MISTKELATMSVQDLAKAAETRHQELTQIYQAMAAKITKQSSGSAFLKANNLVSAEYYCQVAKDHPEIFPPTFDVNHFEAMILFFKMATGMKLQDANTSVILKTPRDESSQDCFWYISYVRRRVKELEANPIFKLILQNEPKPRETPLKSVSKT